MTFEATMTAAAAAMAAGSYSLAYECFSQAHMLGHDVRRTHFAAHRGMISAAWRGRRFERAVSNLLLLTAAWLFDWPRRQHA